MSPGGHRLTGQINYCSIPRIRAKTYIRRAALKVLDSANIGPGKAIPPGGVFFFFFFWNLLVIPFIRYLYMRFALKYTLSYVL